MAASLKYIRTPITTPPYQVPSVDVTPDPPIFSLVTTFKAEDIFMCHIQQCFICRPLDSTVMEAAGIEPKTVAALALTVRGSNYWA
jgi:hypothetical protein